MANIHDCLQRAVDAGELDRTRAEEAGRQYDQLVARYEGVMPRAAAEARAAEDLKEATRSSARRRAHTVLNQLQSMRRLRALVEEGRDPSVALRSLIEHVEGGGFAGESVKSVRDALILDVNAGLREVLNRHSRNLAGNVRQRAGFENIVRELHGEASGDATAVALADAVRTQQDRLRRMFNAHGGDIGQLSDYGLPHAHDTARLRKAGFDAWADEIAPRLDWTRITDRTTGRPFAADGAAPPADRQRAFLREIYDGIASRGWDVREPSMALGGKALYNQRAEPRILHFRSGSDWLEYNRAFGVSDPFSAMIGGLHAMARDVALMRVLGPNPRLGLEYAGQVATKLASSRMDPALERKVGKALTLTRATLMEVDGSVNVPVDEAWGAFFGGARRVLTSIQLGSAILSSATDLATLSTAAQSVGMGGARVLTRHVDLMTRAATRETAAQMGYVADSLADLGASAARFTGDTFAPELTERLSGFTMRASGMSFWTDMARTAFRMEFAGYLAQNAARDFGGIDAPLRRLFDRRGITAADWDRLRADETLFRSSDGAAFLAPSHWRAAQTGLPPAEADGLAIRLQMLIEEQLEYAVPTVSVEMKARMRMGQRPGSIPGEFLNSLLMYKNFALSLTVNQIRRFNDLPTPMAKAAYAAKLGAGLTVLGAVAVQLKEIAKGRDPRPMDDRKFWAAAVLQGGGLGIFGDFFSAKTSRVGGGFAQTLAGPVVGLADDLGDLVAAPTGRGLANFVRYNTPVGSSLWYQRLAFDRLVADQLQAMLDPEATRAWRRQERARLRDYGTQTFWPRGAVLPERAPDLSNALGDAR